MTQLKLQLFIYAYILVLTHCRESEKRYIQELQHN